MLPGLSMPPPGKPLGTNATPYGLRSPLAGTVEMCSGGGNGRGRMGVTANTTPFVALKNIINISRHRTLCFIFSSQYVVSILSENASLKEYG
jgi:hypothetical protein